MLPTGKFYWVALARGADFERLRKEGFTVFYPMIDDYVFLEACDDNKKLIDRTEELKVKFIKSKGGKSIQTVRESELKGLQGSVEDGLVPGIKVRVVEGYCQNLDGVIINRIGQELECEVSGYKRKFRATLTTMQVVKGGLETILPLTQDVPLEEPE